MKALFARICAGLFCVRHLFKGYRVQTFWRGMHGPTLQVDVVAPDGKVVKCFFNRPTYTAKELERIQLTLQALLDKGTITKAEYDARLHSIHQQL